MENLLSCYGEMRAEINSQHLYKGKEVLEIAIFSHIKGDGEVGVAMDMGWRALGDCPYQNYCSWRLPRINIDGFGHKIKWEGDLGSHQMPLSDTCGPFLMSIVQLMVTHVVLDSY